MTIRAKVPGYLHHTLSNLTLHQLIYYQTSDRPYIGFATLMDFPQQEIVELIRSNNHHPILQFAWMEYI